MYTLKNVCDYTIIYDFFGKGHISQCLIYKESEDVTEKWSFPALYKNFALCAPKNLSKKSDFQ